MLCTTEMACNEVMRWSRTVPPQIDDLRTHRHHAGEASGKQLQLQWYIFVKWLEYAAIEGVNPGCETS